ncbi:MAG TPA: condensation domain-containing protein, partial [Anaerovoracaceae bacterium]|nr:condensation domain-containing protein [Anaerovoracaceae bacterium]
MDGQKHIAWIREELGKILPDYMIPGYLMQIPSIPMTRNGKLDKKALPEIEVKAEHAYIGPRNDIEEQLCQIFSEVLGVEQVGIYDNFFELGGHSLKVTRLGNLLEERTGVRLPLRQVFMNPTVQGLGEEIVKVDGKGYLSIPRAQEKDFYPLSLAQESLWTASMLGAEGVMNIYIPFVFKGIDSEVFHKAVKGLFERHQALRTRFKMVNGIPMQMVENVEGMNFIYNTIDISTEYGKAEDKNAFLADYMEQEGLKPIDLQKDLMVRGVFAHLAEGLDLFLFVVHHMVFDGISTQILMEDLQTLYMAYKEGKENPLPPLEIQYVDYAEWERNRLQGEIKEQLKQYWRKKLGTNLPVLNLKTDYERTGAQEGHSITIRLNEEITEKLQKVMKETQSTLFTVLLSSIYALMYRYTGESDIVIGTVFSDRIHKQLEKQIGYYLNTLPLRTQFDGEGSYRELIEAVKNTVVEGFQHSEYPYVEMVKDIETTRNKLRSGLFDIFAQLIEYSTEEVYKTGFAGIECDNIIYQEKQSKYDMVFDFVKRGDSVDLCWQYNNTLFKEETIRRMSKQLEKIIQEIICNIDQTLVNSTRQ